MNRWLLTLLLLPTVVLAQSNPAAQVARQWRQQHERAIVDEFVTLLSAPNISRDRENIERNAELISQMMRNRGIDARLVSVPEGNPVVFGEIRTPSATRTIGFYAHYDGQPLDPKEWASPPFEPTLRDKPVENGGKVIPLPPAGAMFDPEWRLYARGAADDKAPIVALMTAFDAIRAAGIALKSNVKFAFEGEEEAGSLTSNRRWQRTRTSLQQIFGSCATRRSIRPDSSRSFLVHAASPQSTSQFMDRASNSTVATTATGRRIQLCHSRGCLPL